MARKRRKKKIFKSVMSLLVLIVVAGYQLLYGQGEVEKGESFEVTLSKTVDGDTAWFLVDGQDTKVRFLYIDTPESTNEIEPYGKEASKFVAQKLTQAQKIELELNSDGDQYDKYDRMLAWVFIDGKLLQEEIAREGYCKKFYDYGYQYTYKEDIIKADEQAREEKKGIYSTEKDTEVSFLTNLLFLIF